MDQKQRNKIAWGLTIALVPLLIYLLMTNVARVGKKNPPPPEPATVGAPGAEAVPSPVQPPPRSAAPADPKILAEQKRIATLLPENNPFSSVRSISADPAPVADAPTPPPAAIVPSAAPDASVKLTAIVSRGAGRMAMINGRFLGEGDHIGNWTIVKVTNSDVLLKDGARQMILRLK